MDKGINFETYSIPICSVISRGILPASVPFVTSTIGYFYSHLFLNLAPEMTAWLKTIPIFFLAAYCLVRGQTQTKYKYFVAAGLLASSVGDYYLVWRDDDNFLKGMGAFALAHILYILAFGFKSISPTSLVFSIGLGTNVIQFLIPHLKGVLVYGVPCYIVLISTMFWRAFASLQLSCTWTRAIGAFGALIFAVSDFNLALNAFYFAVPYRGHHLVTIVTYYIGQLCIALSAVDRDEMARSCLEKIKKSV